MTTKTTTKPANTDDPRRAAMEALFGRLDAIEAAEDEARGRLRRRLVRAPFRRLDVAARVHHPGGGSTDRRVLARDLAAGGCGIAVNGYLHVGTRLELSLPRFGGPGRDAVAGRVLYCRHRLGPWHAIGVKFDRRVFPRLYLDPADAAGADLYAGQPDVVAGRVLLADASEADRRLLAHLLRETRVELDGVADVAAATAKLTADPRPDLLVIELPADGELLAAASAANVRVAGCSADSGDVDADAVLGVLRKPYERQRVVGQLAEWLAGAAALAGRAGDDAERVTSAFADQPDLLPLIDAFAADARKLGLALGQSAAAGDVDRCRAICRSLRGSGGGYGFALLTDSAAEAGRALDATGNIDGSLVALERVQDLCARLSVPANGSE